MKKIVYLTLSSGFFFLLSGCGPTPSSTPPGTVSASPSLSPPVSLPTSSGTTPSGEPTTTPASGVPASPSPAPSTAPLQPNISRRLATLRLETDRRLFDAFGQTGQLQVIALDAAGAALPLEQLSLSFSSQRPTDFSVSETGQVKALKDNGFSTVRVTDEATGQFAEITLSVASAGSSGGGGGGGGGSAPPTPATLNTIPEFEGLEEDPA